MKSYILTSLIALLTLTGETQAFAQKVLETFTDMRPIVGISPGGEVWGAKYIDNHWSPVRFDGASWKVVTDEEGNGLSFWMVMSQFVFDSNGDAWVGFDGGVGRYDGRTWKVYMWSATGGNVYSLAVAPNGDIWCGSDYGNIYRIHADTWTQFHIDDVFNWVGSVAVTPDGTVWAGLTQGGYYRLNGSNWEATGPAGSFKSQSTLAVDKDGAIWAEVEGGVARFDGVTWKTYTPADGLVNSQVQSITAADDGTVWIGTSGGISRFRNGGWTNYTPANGLPSGAVRSIAITGNGLVWIGTEKGVVLFDPESTPVEVEQNQPLPFAIRGNYPNPFNPSTTISFTLLSTARADLAVYSISGQKVRTLLSERMTAGTHSTVWDGKDDSGKSVSSGVYLAYFRAGNHVSSQKMLLMK